MLQQAHFPTELLPTSEPQECGDSYVLCSSESSIAVFEDLKFGNVASDSKPFLRGCHLVSK